MATGRPASLVATCDQWVRATHHATAVDGDELTLTWSTAPEPQPVAGRCRARGLATDRLCRVYRLVPGGVERLTVGPLVDGIDYARLPDPVALIGPVAPPETGPDFAATGTGPALDPTGIAIDHNDRLFLADGTANTIAVIDLWSRRLLRTVSTEIPDHPSRTPTGLAHRDGVVYAALRDPGALIRLTATRGPDTVPWPSAVADLPPGARPSRVAVLPDGTPAVLFTEPSGDGWLIAGERPPRAVGPASDLAVDADGAVVVAPCRAEGSPTALGRLVPTGSGWTRSHPLDATGYDGGGIVVARDGRVGYFTADGFRVAVIARVEYAVDGACTTYRLDSGVPRNRWGRILIEACVPDGTECLVAAVTSDDEHETAVGHSPPDPAACAPGTAVSPPLPPLPLATDLTDPTARLHRRPDPTTPWWRRDERYTTFEAPVMAAPGRYLWVTVRLRGNRRRTPRVRELRVEHESHGLLRRLPAVYSVDRDQAEFLHRYLATVDGVLHDLDLRARCRDVLVDPHGTPAEALSWLASFCGLVLDDRWAETARRQLVAEIVTLYRRRGTLWALGRYLELFLAGDRASDAAVGSTVSPVILEHFRLRGVGGPLLGGDPELSSRAVVGAGFRVGGAVGEPESRPLDPLDPATSSFTSHAHRFSVLIPRPLGAEEEAAIRHVLETERPAHTIYDLCTVDAGMRVGDGLHLGVSSIIGPTGAFERAVTGLTLLGRRSVLGPPWSGLPVEAARIGSTTRIG